MVVVCIIRGSTLFSKSVSAVADLMIIRPARLSVFFSMKKMLDLEAEDALAVSLRIYVVSCSRPF